jgi:hypothetical protein
MESIIKVGRREFNSDTFLEAVKNSKTYSEVCDNLGMNKTVQTTINTLKEVISDLGIDIKHFTYKYTISDKLGKASIKEYNFSENNQQYYDTFKNSFDKITSWQQYKVDNGSFLEALNEKDFATITIADIENYVNSKNAGEQTKNNCKAHIRSMMIYAVKNNINGAFDKVSKDILVYLI